MMADRTSLPILKLVGLPADQLDDLDERVKEMPHTENEAFSL